MTEYTSSPEAIQVFMSSRERTERWVRSHSPFDAQFLSPSIPPAALEEDRYGRDNVSEPDSTHSLPPKMVLKYGDGRPDVPISHWHYENRTQPAHDNRPCSNPQIRPAQRGNHHASSSHPRPLHYTLDPEREQFVSAPVPSRHENLSYPPHHTRRALVDIPPSHGPEEIRIYPADTEGLPPSNSSHRPRHSSEPVRQHHIAPAPYTSAAEIVETPTPRYVPTTLHVPQAPQVTYSQSAPLPAPAPAYDHHSHRTYANTQSSRHPHPPPSIMYAPGKHPGKQHAPPTLVYAPHHAPGMTYTMSAPAPQVVLPPQYPRITPAPYPYVHSHLPSVHEHEENRIMPSEYSRGPRGPRPQSARPEDMHRRPPRTPSPASEESGDSGSTYYVIPTPGQKVKVLVGPEASLYTATSTTKSPPSPYSSSPMDPYHAPPMYTGPPYHGGHPSPKKPFFNRIFGFNSNKTARQVRRRHSFEKHPVPPEYTKPH